MSLERFAALSDYELHWLVTHVAATENAGAGSATQPSERAAELLLKLLRSPEFALANAARFGAQATVSDFLTAHDVLTRARPGELGALSHGLATAAILDSAGPDPKLDPDTLHAVLGYRADAIYAEALELAIEGDLVVQLVPEEATRTWVLCGFLHSAATRYRRLGGSKNLEVARSLLVKASAAASTASAASTVDEQRAERLSSSVLYDLGYIAFLTGERQAAQDRFRASAHAARRAGDTTGYYISRCLELLIGFYAGEVSAEMFGGFLADALERLTAASKDSPHAERWVMNARAHLFDLACLRDDLAGARAHLGALEADPWVRSVHLFDPFPTWNARYALLGGDYSEACRLYEAVLRDELAGPAASCVRESAARDLLDYGRALAATGEDARAREIWEFGLMCPDHAGNWPWKETIAERVAAIAPP